MFDEFKVKLSTKFMRNIVAKLLAKAIQKKFGCKVKIQLNELDVRVINGDTNIKANVEVKLDSQEFMKIMEAIDMD
jgi:hypothetical protein